MREAPEHYETAARVAFAPAHGSSDRIPFRSTLEARWALLFERLGLAWTYEPRTFALEHPPMVGRRYTPDFHVEGVGWLEVKPHAAALQAVEPKLHAFARLIAREGERFFSLTADAPRLAKWPGLIPPVLEWLPGRIRPVPASDAYPLFACETGKGIHAESPEAYADYFYQVVKWTGREVADSMELIGESLFRKAIEAGEDFDTLRVAYLNGEAYTAILTRPQNIPEVAPC